MAYTLVLLAALLGQAPEWSIQHFDSPEACAEAGAVIIQAYKEEFLFPQVLAKCTISQEA